MPNQRERGYAFSPSGMLHEVHITFNGNIVTAITTCGVIVNIKKWRRMVREGTSTTLDPNIRAEVKCPHCFA